MPPLSSHSDRIPLLICEDEAELRAILVTGLAYFGIDARAVADGVALDAALQRQRPSVVVLDIGLPGENGLAIARRLSAPGNPPLGIIMLTARGTLDDRLEGMQDGADVYFVKPVDLRELAGAIRNLHQRVRQATGPAQSAYSLDALHSTLGLPTGQHVSLTTTELRLLQLLALNPGEVVARSALLENLEQPQDLPAMQRLETQISRLRSKVRQVKGADPLPIQASHGVGYAFRAPLWLRP